MRQPRAPRLVALFMAAALALPAGYTAAVVPQETASTPAQVRLDLDRLRNQIAALEARLDEMGDERANLVDEFEAADVRLAISRRELEIIRIRLQVLFTQRSEREAEVERLSGELEEARAELADRVVALYRMGPLSYSRFLFAADDPEEVLSNYQLVGRLAAQDRTLVSNIGIRIEQHQRAVEAMNETARDWEQTRREETLAIRRLSDEQDQRQELIRRIDIEAEAQRQALADQEESAAALEELLGEVAGQPVTAAAGGSRPAFAAARGELPWPAEGRITEAFGRKVHPVYKTITLMKGIEIDAGAGTPVQAVYQGRVQFADWFQNYGNVVIVNHGNDFFTIYGHLETMAVRSGEWVDAGDEVGTVGETGSLIGPSLYFEIRDGSEAVNPVQWLRSR
jgi:septal ring factor EnvC (AmiA/AmiB activator)